ncbi:hypothetical protein WA026_003129 [Henosepilachna vigintioctopunctata]|uniref:Uncharacterized protein n=1 Tax=Henosepilachna vigintioctopunctata TaxID=420089 RepID=A0AAW1TN42_9CUCU
MSMIHSMLSFMNDDEYSSSITSSDTTVFSPIHRKAGRKHLESLSSCGNIGEFRAKTTQTPTKAKHVRSKFKLETAEVFPTITKSDDARVSYKEKKTHQASVRPYEYDERTRKRDTEG